MNKQNNELVNDRLINDLKIIITTLNQTRESEVIFIIFITC